MMLKAGANPGHESSQPIFIKYLVCAKEDRDVGINIGEARVSHARQELLHGLGGCATAQRDTAQGHGRGESHSLDAHSQRRSSARSLHCTWKKITRTGFFKDRGGC